MTKEPRIYYGEMAVLSMHVQGKLYRLMRKNETGLLFYIHKKQLKMGVSKMSERCKKTQEKIVTM